MKNNIRKTFIIFGIFALGPFTQNPLKCFGDPPLPVIASSMAAQNSEQVSTPDLEAAKLYSDSLEDNLHQGPLSLSSPHFEKAPALSLKKSLSDSSFSVQVGVGLTLVPLRFLFANHEGIYLLQSGLGGHIFLRAHPRVTLDLGISVLFSTYSTALQYWVYELPTLFGIRIHLDKDISFVKRSPFSPYLLFATGINLAQLFTQQSQGLEQAVYFETQVGVGIEFRLPHDFALTLDLRGLFNARIDSQIESFFTTLDGIVRPSLANTRVGGQVVLGIIGYF